MGYVKQFLSQTKDMWVEAFGVFMLVLVSTSSLVTLNLSGQATTAAVMLVGVLSYAAVYGWLLYIFDSRQRGYFNPAITLLQFLRGQVTFNWFIAAVLVQLASGLLASITVALLFGPAAVEVQLGAVQPAGEMGPLAALIAEVLGSLLIVITILRTRTDQSALKKASLIGFSLGIAQLFSMGISGSGLNPVRALAPQLVAASANDWWVYCVGPFVATVIGWFGAKWLTAEVTVDESESLQQKARQALQELRAQVESKPAATLTESEAEVQLKPQSSPVIPPPTLQPSFQSDTEPTESSSPTPTPTQTQTSSSPKPHSVSFVNYDAPEDQPSE